MVGQLPINLAGADDATYSALARARALGADALFEELKASGLQGRGGARDSPPTSNGPRCADGPTRRIAWW